jgi:hypothetical protein
MKERAQGGTNEGQIPNVTKENQTPFHKVEKTDRI